MPMPKKMSLSLRFGLAGQILRGKFNVVSKTQTGLLEEMTLRNRSKEWYKNRDEGKYPWLEPEFGKSEEVDGGLY